MKYREFIPCEALRQYVRCYYIFEPGENMVVEDRAFATGCIEIMFNMGADRWQTATADGCTTTPEVELWGQIIAPLTFRAHGNNSMLGIRFYPHTAAVFLNEDIRLFNNSVTDFCAVAGKPVRSLYTRLRDTTALNIRIALIETFLLERLSSFEKRFDKLALINGVMKEMRREDFSDNIENIACRYGIGARYLRKLFLQYTGLTPKLLSKINRFQKGLQLIAGKNASLTSIAYECGYFDQSHFIREFKSFTGFIPSDYNAENSSAALILPVS